uniref:Uncharacterized protein n=1 Tax=Musca domestica TaxID=7370 RepID=A0A1I8NJG1_MUSDO
MSFEENGTFNIAEIVRRTFPEHETPEAVLKAMDAFKYEDYKRRYTAISSIFKNTPKMYQQLQPYAEMNWIGTNSSILTKLICESKGLKKSKTVENILILTSLMENTLANIYFTETNGKFPPHLLRDLISTPEIRKVLGAEMYYETVLFTAIYSLGFEFEETKYVIKERPLVKDFLQPLQHIDDKFKSKIVDIKTHEENMKNIHNEFAKDYIEFWTTICKYYQEGRYINMIILILPQIELLLRLHYGQVNNVDINAKLDEYYITMDTIFEAEIVNCKTGDKECDYQPNRILDFDLYPQFEGTFHLMYDIFFSPNGCRLRDKVSHGEVDYLALNNSELASITLHIFLNLLEPLDFNSLFNNESKLHLNSVNKCLFKEVHVKLNKFKNVILQNNSVETFQIILNLPTRKVLIFQRPNKESELMLLMKVILDNIGCTLDNYQEAIEIRTAQLAQRELHSKRRKTLEKMQMSLPQIYSTLAVMFKSLINLFNLLQSNHQLVFKEADIFDKTLRYLKHSRTISENMVKYSHYESNEWIKALDLCRKFQEFYNKWFMFSTS